MTDRRLLVQKLATMAEHVARIRRRRPPEMDALRRNVDLQDAIGMSLLVCTQEALDIAFHLCADEAWGIPSSNADSFAILARHQAIDVALSDEMARVTSLRNRIAHGYASIDVERLWQELPNGLDAFEHFMQAMARWVEPQETTGD